MHSTSSSSGNYSILLEVLFGALVLFFVIRGGIEVVHFFILLGVRVTARVLAIMVASWFKPTSFFFRGPFYFYYLPPLATLSRFKEVKDKDRHISSMRSDVQLRALTGAAFPILLSLLVVTSLVPEGGMAIPSAFWYLLLVTSLLQIVDIYMMSKRNRSLGEIILPVSGEFVVAILFFALTLALLLVAILLPEQVTDLVEPRSVDHVDSRWLAITFASMLTLWEVTVGKFARPVPLKKIARKQGFDSVDDYQRAVEDLAAYQRGQT